MEDDGARNDSHEYIILWYVMKNIYLFHLSAADLIEHLHEKNQGIRATWGPSGYKKICAKTIYSKKLKRYNQLSNLNDYVAYDPYHLKIFPTDLIKIAVNL